MLVCWALVERSDFLGCCCLLPATPDAADTHHERAKDTSLGKYLTFVMCQTGCYDED